MGWFAAKLSILIFYFHGYEAIMSVFTVRGRRKRRTAYTFQYSRTYILGSFFFDVFEFQEAGFVNWSDQVWFALSFASIIDREFLSVQRKNWTQNESSSFLLPVLVRTERYALITNIPQVSVTKTMQVCFLQHIPTGGALWLMASLLWDPSCRRLLRMEFHRSQ